MTKRQQKIIDCIKEHIDKIKNEVKNNGYNPLLEYSQDIISIHIYLMLDAILKFKTQLPKSYEEYIMLCGYVYHVATCGTKIRNPNVCEAINNFLDYIGRILYEEV